MASRTTGALNRPVSGRLGPAAGAPLREHAREFGGLDGLREVVVHAGVQAALAVALHGVGGHGHDDDRRLVIRMFGLVLLALADFLGGFEPAVGNDHNLLFATMAFLAGCLIAPALTAQTLLVTRLAPAKYATEAFTWSSTFIVTGLVKKELWAVKPDGHGIVTDTHVAWKLNTHIGKYASPLLVDGLIYTPAEESFVTCIEADTGNVVWTERIGGKYAASPIYADGRLYFFSQEGTTTVLKPGRALEVLATNKLDNGFMACPAADGKAFFLRTRTHLYRVEATTSAR